MTEGGDWEVRLPGRIERCRRRWGLTLHDRFPSGVASWAAPGVDGAGRAVVLKIQHPHRESDGEALALRTWAGDGAVQLLDDAPDDHALLLERLEPGRPLGTADPEVAIDVLAGLVRRLSVPAPPGLGTARDEAAHWRAQLPATRDRHHPDVGRLLEATSEILDDLVTSAAADVLVNQDLHGDNVLSAAREPWLVIDPKPLAGELEFAIAPIVRSVELGTGRAAVLRRFDALVDVLGLDADRARDWTVAQTIAWSAGAGVARRSAMHDTARWLLDER